MKKQSNQERRREAAGDGSSTFVPLKKCPRCTTQLRYVSSNQCVLCTKIRARRADQEMKDYIREHRRPAVGSE